MRTALAGPAVPARKLAFSLRLNEDNALYVIP